MILIQIEYFMNNLDRISDREFIPNKKDIIELHWPTTAIMEVKLKLDNITTTIVDVGGLRNGMCIISIIGTVFFCCCLNLRFCICCMFGSVCVVCYLLFVTLYIF